MKLRLFMRFFFEHKCTSTRSDRTNTKEDLSNSFTRGPKLSLVAPFIQSNWWTSFGFFKRQRAVEWGRKRIGCLGLDRVGAAGHGSQVDSWHL